MIKKYKKGDEVIVTTGKDKGKIGKIENVNFEYVQDWSDGKVINKKNAKEIFKWRLDKKTAGISLVLNELGSHAYHLASYISGIKAKKVLILSSFFR